jgi:hypothetical protein
MTDIIDTFDAFTVRLTYMDDKIEDVKYQTEKPIHLVENIPYGIIKRIMVGSQLRVYGLVSQKVNGEVQPRYLHLDAGDYQLKVPILFQSFHINNITV